MDNKICTTCGHGNATRSYFCTQCGSKLRREQDGHSRLCVLAGEPAGVVFKLKKGRNPIGRDIGNLIVLSDQQISNKHAVVMFEDNGFWIEDRNSKNGIFVNGKKVARERLHDGDVIRLGSTVMRFDEQACA